MTGLGIALDEWIDEGFLSLVVGMEELLGILLVLKFLRTVLAAGG